MELNKELEEKEEFSKDLDEVLSFLRDEFFFEQEYISLLKEVFEERKGALLFVLKKTFNNLLEKENKEIKLDEIKDLMFLLLRHYLFLKREYKEESKENCSHCGS